MLDNPLSQITFRSIDPDDKNFIYATWLNSYFSGSRFAKHISHRTFYNYHQEVIERILANPRTEVLIAASVEDPKVIFGYLIYQKATPAIIQYVYIKHAFKKLGIATDLIEKADIGFPHCIVTHWTFDLESALDKYPSDPDRWENRYPELTYIPYLI